MGQVHSPALTRALTPEIVGVSLHPGGHMWAADGVGRNTNVGRVLGGNGHSRAVLPLGFPYGWKSWFSVAKPVTNFPCSYNIMKQNPISFTILTRVCYKQVWILKKRKLSSKAAPFSFTGLPLFHESAQHF